MEVMRCWLLSSCRQTPDSSVAPQQKDGAGLAEELNECAGAQGLC